jgi:hypothetical protein
MPRTSIADLIVDWEMLLAKLQVSAAGLPGLESFIARLEKLLANAKDLTARLETARGIKQQESQQRRDLLREGKNMTSRLRAALKAHFGLQNERLVEFGIRPIRARAGRTQPQPSPLEPETPDKPEPEPTAPSPPPTSESP